MFYFGSVGFFIPLCFSPLPLSHKTEQSFIIVSGWKRTMFGRVVQKFIFMELTRKVSIEFMNSDSFEDFNVENESCFADFITCFSSGSLGLHY